MRTVFFYGRLAEEFGEKLRLNVETVGQMVRLMEANFPGKFVKAIKPGTYRVVLGKNLDTGFAMSEEALPMLLGSQDLHIFPLAEGHGGDKKGFFTVVLGIALVATGIGAAAGGIAAGVGGFGAPAGALGAFGVTWGNVAMFGASLLLQGIASLLTPTPKVESYAERNTPDARPSFLFTGPVNVIEEGGPVPICYGRFGVGSVVVSGGLESVQLPAST